MNIWVWARSGLHSALIHSAQTATPTEAKVLMRSGKNALSTCTRTSTTVASALSTSASAPSSSSHCHIIMFPRHVSFLSVPTQYVHILYFRISFVSEHPLAPAIHWYRVIYCTQPHSLDDCFCSATQDWRLLLLLLLLKMTANVPSAATDCLSCYPVSTPMSVSTECTLLMSFSRTRAF